MRSLATLALVSALVFAATPQAQAGKTEKAIIGGLLGGILIGAALADDDHHVHTSVSVGSHYGHRGGCGYYDWVSVRTWVPARYEICVDSHGHRYRSWVAGHYAFVKDKVWIDGCHDGCGHGRSYGRGGHRHHGRHGHYGYRR